MSQTEQATDNDCIMDREWCDGPEVEQLEKDALFGGICVECYTERMERDLDE